MRNVKNGADNDENNLFLNKRYLATLFPSSQLLCLCTVILFLCMSGWMGLTKFVLIE